MDILYMKFPLWKQTEHQTYDFGVFLVMVFSSFQPAEKLYVRQ